MNKLFLKKEGFRKTVVRQISCLLTLIFVLLGTNTYAQYCTTPSLTCSFGDMVTTLTLATITNNPVCGTGGYEDYTSSVATRNVVAGLTYPVTVETGYSSQDVGVWIDYNHSNSWDASEYTYIGITSSAFTPLTTNITIPSSALGGPTRMRVGNIWTLSGSLSSANPCMTSLSGFGNVEDYTVNITAAGPPTCIALPTTPANAATGICAGTTTLSWPAVAAATGYDVYLNAGTGTPTTIVSTNQAGTSYNATVAAGPYVWKVIPKNSSGAATGCATWTFTVIANPVPDIIISASPGSNVCVGTQVSFTASIVNGGTTPLYQWRRGNLTVGTGATYSFTAGLANNGDLITAILTSNATCAAPTKDTSNLITIGVVARPNTTVTASATSICAGDSAVLTATSGTGLAYQWLINNSAIAGATTATFKTPAGGDYRVLVSNGSCADTSAITNIAVKPLPIATTTPTGAQTFCSNNVLTIGAYSDPSYTYQWNKNGTAIAGETAPAYIATATGVYTVTATLNGCSATSAPVTATVNAAPSATITAIGLLSFCAPGSVLLSANTGTGLTYQWLRNGVPIFPAATGSTYTATTSGAYTVAVSNTNCAAVSGSVTVTASTLPSAAVTTVGATTFCQGSSVTFRAAQVAGYVYQWYRNGVIIAGSTTYQYIATTAGAYHVVITNGACTTTTTDINVIVNTLPVATATAAGPIAFCEGGSVILAANTATGFTYQWRRNGTPIAGATDPLYTVTLSGFYQVVVSNGTCPNTSTAINVVVSTPVTAVLTAQGPTNFCNNNSVVLSANTGAGYTYQWQKDGVNVAGATGATYTAAGSGSYRVIVKNGTCADTSAPQTVAVTPPPPTVVTASGALNFCQGGSVVFTANAAPGFHYQWMLNGVPIPGDTLRAITAAISGNYTVLIFDGFCPGTSVVNTVTVNPVPVASVTVTGGNVLNASGAYNTYQWYRNGTMINGANAASYTATQDGYYAVVVSDNIGCSATSSIQHVTSLGIGNASVNAGVHIYPNPSIGMVKIESANAVDVVLSTTDGREVIRKSTATGIDLSPYAEGFYLLRISDHKTGALIKIEKLTKSGQ